MFYPIISNHSTTTKIKQLDKNNLFKVYPNPVVDKVNIDVSSSIGQPFSN